jgi:hypothetical protein
MKLKQVNNVVEFGRWATALGFRCTGGPGPFGPPSPGVHSSTSLHYADPSRALDINFDRSNKRWDNEHQACNWLFNRVLRYELRHPSFPLNEMFFENRGYKYYTDDNVPISNHYDHLHIGFSKNSW